MPRAFVPNDNWVSPMARWCRSRSGKRSPQRTRAMPRREGGRCRLNNMSRILRGQASPGSTATVRLPPTMKESDGHVGFSWEEAVNLDVWLGERAHAERDSATG